MTLISLLLLLSTCLPFINANTWPVQVQLNNMTSQPSSQYDEAVIVGLVTNIYKALLELGQFEDHEVIWSPAEGHQLDFSRLDETSRIDSRVVSLMRRLPMVNSYMECAAPGMVPVNYLDPEELSFSRDIDKLQFWAPPGEERLDMANAKPTVLQLLQGQESDDPCLVLDIADSTSPRLPPSTQKVC